MSNEAHERSDQSQEHDFAENKKMTKRIRERGTNVVPGSVSREEGKGKRASELVDAKGGGWQIWGKLPEKKNSRDRAK